MESILLRAFAAESVGLLTPAPMLFVLLLIASPRGLSRAAAYACGYCSSYTVLGWVVLLISQILVTTGRDSGGSSPITAWISIGLGVLLLMFGVRAVTRGRSAADDKPRFFTMLDTMSAGRAFGFGVLTSAMIFQNLGIYLMGVAVVAEGELSHGAALLAIVPLALFFCLPAIAPVALFGVLPRRATGGLQNFRRVIETHHRVITMTAMFVVGSMLVLRGIFGLG